MINEIVAIRSGGEIGTAVAHKLHRCGFKVLILEVNTPSFIRSEVSFGKAIYHGLTVVEGVTAVKIKEIEEIEYAWENGVIPISIDPNCQLFKRLKPYVVVDATLAKRNIGTNKTMAPITIALGPGYEAGVDVDVVIETNRGHNLGRLIFEGCCEKDTGMPGNIMGYAEERILRATAKGKIKNLFTIGAAVKKGQIISYVEGAEIKAQVDGVLRGIIRDGFIVEKGLKIGDIDPRGKKEYCYTISDKGRTIAGGVLEAILLACRRGVDNKMESELFMKVGEELGKNSSVALVILTKVDGASPGIEGSMMAVFEDGSTLGTIGGGGLEFSSIKNAKACLAKGQGQRFQYDLSSEGSLGMICGGAAEGYIKVINSKPKLIVIGGGHIAAELNKLSNFIDMEAVIFENREEYGNKERFPQAELRLGAYEETLRNYNISSNCFVVIVTHGHSYDEIALKSVINSDAAYIGMIGSKEKTQQVMKNLKEVGISEEKLNKVYAPIGLNLGGRSPKEIALSIIAEIMAIKNGGTLEHMKLCK